MPVEIAVDHFLTACKAEGLSPRTVRYYSSRLGQFIEPYQNRFIAQISRHDVRSYVAALWERDTLYEDHPIFPPKRGGLSPSSVKGHVRAIRRFFHWLVLEGYIEAECNPAAGVKLPKVPKTEPKAIQLNDLRRVIRATEGDDLINIRDRALVLFLADTGCRLGGLISLTVDNLDLSRLLAMVTEKGNKVRPVPFSPATGEALERWLALRPTDAGEWVFLSTRSAKPLTASGVLKRLEKLAQIAGVDGRVNPHAFRHGFARQYLLNGGDLGTLADLMGHTDVRVTKDYYAVYSTEELAQQHRRFTQLNNVL